MLSSHVTANDGLTQSQIQSKQVSTFSDWKSNLHCHYVERDDEKQILRTHHFIATSSGANPTLRMKTTDGDDNPKGVFTQSDWVKADGQTMKRKEYSQPTTGYSSVSLTTSHGGRRFTYNTNQGQRTVLLYPDGFYVAASQNSSPSATKYLGGC